MHTVIKVLLSGKVKFFTQGAFELALGTDIEEHSQNVEEIERFKVMNAQDLEDELFENVEREELDKLQIELSE